MPCEGGSQSPLSYARQRPKASRPALSTEVGCGSSLLGAVALAIALPWAAVRGFVYDGAPSLVGAGLTVIAAAAIGGIVGALVVPAIVLSISWVICRIVGRP